MTLNPPLSAESEFFRNFWRLISRSLKLSETPPPARQESLPEPEILEAPMLYSLQELLGENSCAVDVDTLRNHTATSTYTGFLSQFTPSHLPQAVVYPENEHEIAALMVWAGERELQLVPWGGGTDPLGYKSNLSRPFVVVNLERLHRLLEIDRFNQYVRVQSGIPWIKLESILEGDDLTTGQLFPHPEATVGGSIAKGSPGLKALEYGTLRDNVVMLRAITPAGPIALKKPLLGEPDWRGLMLGAHGSWGIITEATLRLHARPLERLAFTIGFSSWEQALEASRRLLRERKLMPSWIRIIGAKELALFAAQNRVTRLQSLRLSVLGEPPVSETQLVVGLEGVGEMLTARRHRIEALMKEAGGRIEILDRAAILHEDPAQQIRPLLPLLWERNILAHIQMAAVPWNKAAEFRKDWEETLRSVLQATSRTPGLTATAVYPMENAVIFSTLLLGQQAAENAESRRAQWEAIQAVVHETLIRWRTEGGPSLLLNQSIDAAGNWLDPDGIMIR